MVDQAENPIDNERASQPTEVTEELVAAIPPEAEAEAPAPPVAEERDAAEAPQDVEGSPAAANGTEGGEAEQPVAEESMDEQPMDEGPMAEQPMDEEPMAEQPMDEEPMAAALQEQGSEQAEGTSPAGNVPVQSHKQGESRRRERRHRLPEIERPKIVKTLAVGMELEGKVKRLSEFGAFIDIGVGRDGLVHVSEMRVGRVNKPSDVVKEGDSVRVWIRELDREKNRISLTMIAPGTKRFSDLNEGDLVQGKVTRLAPYGAFVDIGVGRDGMLHVREMAEGFVNRPEDVVQVGEDIEVRVTALDKKRQRIDLSLKGLRPALETPGAPEMAGAVASGTEEGAPPGEERRGDERFERRERDEEHREEPVRRERPRTDRPERRVARQDFNEPREERRGRRGNRRQDDENYADFQAYAEQEEAGPTVFELAMQRAMAGEGKQQKRERKKGHADDFQSEQDDIVVRTLQQRQKA